MPDANIAFAMPPHITYFCCSVEWGHAAGHPHFMDTNQGRVEFCSNLAKQHTIFLKLFVGTLLVTFSNKMNKD
jgi:hypothetical protein